MQVTQIQPSNVQINQSGQVNQGVNVNLSTCQATFAAVPDDPNQFKEEGMNQVSNENCDSNRTNIEGDSLYTL